MILAIKNHASVKIIHKILYNSTIFSETDGHWQCYQNIIFPHSEIKNCGVAHSFHIKIVKWTAFKKSWGNYSFVLDLSNWAIFSLFVLALQVILSWKRPAV